MENSLVYYRWILEQNASRKIRVEQARHLVTVVHKEITRRGNATDSAFINAVFKMTKNEAAEQINYYDALFVLFGVDKMEKGEKIPVAKEVFNNVDNKPDFFNSVQEGCEKLAEKYTNEEAMREDAENASKEAAALNEVPSEGGNSLKRINTGASMEVVTKMHEENNAKTAAWHQEMAATNTLLKEIQPSVSEILNKCLTFTDKFEETFVLKAAKQQIDLYNFIAECYGYHAIKSGESGNADYANAVANYEEYMYMIEDNLASFGVTTIKSTTGTPFDGAKHEAAGDDFSVKDAVVKVGLRAGFAYKDLVIQKEKVML